MSEKAFVRCNCGEEFHPDERGIISLGHSCTQLGLWIVSGVSQPDAVTDILLDFEAGRLGLAETAEALRGAAPSAPEPERRERGSLDPDAQEPDEMLACDPRCEHCRKWRIEGEAAGLMDAAPPAPAVPSEAVEALRALLAALEHAEITGGAPGTIARVGRAESHARAVLARLGRATPQ